MNDLADVAEFSDIGDARVATNIPISLPISLRCMAMIANWQSLAQLKEAQPKAAEAIVDTTSTGATPANNLHPNDGIICEKQRNSRYL